MRGRDFRNSEPERALGVAMATVAESSEANPIPPLPPPPPPPSPSEGHGNNNNNTRAKTLDETTTLWVEYAVHQAQLYQKAIEEALDSALEVSRSRLSQIRSTSSAHFNQTIVIFPPQLSFSFIFCFVFPVWLPRK